MTKIKRLILVLCLVAAVFTLCCVPAFADETVTETQPDTTPVITETSASPNTNVNVYVVDGYGSATLDENGNEIPWTAGGSGVSLLESLFGEYTPYNASGLASVDWAWIADVAMFAVAVVCFFRILGGVIKRV